MFIRGVGCTAVVVEDGDMTTVVLPLYLLVSCGYFGLGVVGGV